MRWFWQASDRRRYPRFKADVPAIASLIGDRDIISLRTRCESISEGGIGTPRLESLALGDLVTLELHLPVSANPIWLDTVVRYSGTDRCGLEFRLLGPNQRKLIKHYCRRQPKEKSRRWLG
jgi:c-di-GMP-binding flagellar brake protein YcgR